MADVSVIIPCYCCADSVVRAVDSVLGQSLPPAEIILIDDASPDDGATLECLRGLIDSTHIPVYLIELPENLGPAGARNAAWAVATSTYVALLDADDAWHKEKLALQYGWMTAHPEVALCGHACMEVGVMPEDAALNSDVQAMPWNLRSMLFKNPLATRSAMLRRDIPIRFSADKRYAEDYLLWLQIAAADLHVVVLDAILAYSFKPAFGISGLSSRMCRMECGVQDDFRRLRESGDIGIGLWLAAAGFSLLKYLRRLTITGLRRVAGKP
ncbi:MAG TPA: glycosyltransferase family 2 protein [Mariprofundaceae bacterium]|nr:glycosyltransferase family 2 protein [Mariprofundaceae bacterium]